MAPKVSRYRLRWPFGHDEVKVAFYGRRNDGPTRSMFKLQPCKAQKQAEFKSDLWRRLGEYRDGYERRFSVTFGR